MPDHNNNLNRRKFLKSAAALGASLALPTIIPASARGADGLVAPSNRLVMGCIGVGGQGSGNMKAFLNFPDVQIVAICDVDTTHLAAAMKTVNRKYENEDCKGCGDFRELTAREDIDVVSIGTPDHWHTLPALAAIRSGKDAYVEKPLTLTIEEGIVLRDEARRLARVVQTGSQQRSGAEFRRACELVRNGRIGELKEVVVGIPGNNKFCPTWQPEAIPKELDYEMWLGAAPAEPFTTMRCHYSFRFIRDYSGGQMTNWGAHHIDIAQWGMGMDESGPVEIAGKGIYPDDGGLFNTAARADIIYTYANGVRLHLTTGSAEGDDGERFSTGTTFIGAKGYVHVNRGQLVTKPESLVRETIGPEELNLYRSPGGHHRNFIDCVKTRKAPAADVAIGHRSATVCHLGNIAMLLGRKLRWDPAAERFVGDEEANRQIGRAMRAPWRLV